jgi:hypothetical protein
MVNGTLTQMTLGSGSGAAFAPLSIRKAMKDVPDIPNLSGLVELGNRDGVDIRPTLLRVMTDLYVQKDKHSDEEERHFTELALRLIDLVDAKTRATVASKIAAHPAAPAAVRQRLLKEAGSPAAPAEPEKSPSVFSGTRATAGELSTLFFTADAEERRLILLNLPYSALAPTVPIGPAAARESIQRLEAAALGHNGEAFIRELERALGIAREQARRVMDDASGEPIVVAAVALGMPADVLQRILLCLNPAISQSVRRIHELALLHEDIEPEAALRLLAVWQAGHRAEKKPPEAAPGHQPKHRRDERRDNAVPAARPKIHWDEYAQTRKTESA